MEKAKGKLLELIADDNNAEMASTLATAYLTLCQAEWQEKANAAFPGDETAQQQQAEMRGDSAAV